MQVDRLGHAVLKVRDRARSEAFYEGVLGIRIARRSDQMTFFTLGNHHDLAILQVSGDAPDPAPDAVGLFHLAFKIGDRHEDLLAAKAELDAAAIPVRPVNHGITESLYVRDPDGHIIELYVDMIPADEWAAWDIAMAEPLVL